MHLAAPPNQQIVGADSPFVRSVHRMRELCFRGLPKMFRPQDRLYAFGVRRSADGRIEQFGVSRRYTAITLLGLAAEDPDAARQALVGNDREDIAQRLLDDVDTVDNLGDVALSIWAARLVGLDGLEGALKRLAQLNPNDAMHATVELAWVLSALSHFDALPGDWNATRETVASRLMDVYRPAVGVFPHMIGANSGGLRRHVACFADLVYPTQALAFYYKRTGDERALNASLTCAQHWCRLQGDAGQWWWHYDARSGALLEGYPVYSVHQDAMGPMALLAVTDACGVSFEEPIERSVAWLERIPELNGESLIDDANDVIWRKVARREPKKFVRKLTAVASKLHSSWRLPGRDAMFPPGAIDFECRPYHLGWLLYAFPTSRLNSWRKANHA
jgi:hypothetical protein